ncbi:hypothetical protein ACX0G7_25980 [Flavitalea antarctica]
MSKYLSYLTTIFCLMVITGFQCDKEEPAPPKQSFVERMALTPAKKVYHIGDTLWLKFITSDKTLLDTISNQRLSSSSLKIFFGASVVPLFQTPADPVDGYCNFITPANTVADLRTSKYGTIVSFDVGCDNATSYDVQIGIILKYSGFYALRLPDWAELKVCRNVVNPYPAASLLFRYDLTDLNNDVYNTIPSSARRDFPNGFNELLINLKAAYAFHVQ